MKKSIVFATFFAILFARSGLSFDSTDDYYDVYETDQNELENESPTKVDDVVPLAPIFIDTPVTNRPTTAPATTETPITNKNQGESINLQELSNNVLSLGQMIGEKTLEDKEWKENMGNEVKSMKKIIKKIMYGVNNVTSKNLDISNNMNQTAKNLNILSDNWNSLKTSVKEMGNYCVSESSKLRKPSNNNTMVNKLESFVLKLDNDIQHFNTIAISLSKFKHDFERDLYKNQVSYWYRLSTAVDTLAATVASLEEITILRRKKLNDRNNKNKPEMESTADLPFRNLTSVNKNDYEDGSASNWQDPNIKNKTTDINSGKIEKELLVSNISKTGEKNTNMDLKDNAGIIRGVENDNREASEDEEYGKSSKANENFDEVDDKPIPVNLTFDEADNRPNSTNMLTEVDEMSRNSALKTPLTKDDVKVTQVNELTEEMARLPFSNFGGRSLDDSEVFNHEELGTRNRRNFKDGELTFFNVPYGQPRLSFEMEQLSKCLELGVTKYEAMLKTMAENYELHLKMKEIIDKIQAAGNTRTWIEVTFFIVCGFLLGNLTGIMTTVAVGICIRKFFSKKSKQIDLGIPEGYNIADKIATILPHEIAE